VTVTAGPAVKLGFATQPLGTPTGVTLPAVTVQVLDQYGNLVTTDNTDSVTVAVASGPGPFTAGSTTTAAVHNGVATFANLTLVVPGSYTLSALVPFSYTGPPSTSFMVAPLQVVPGSFVGSPSGFSLQFNAPFLVNSVTPVLYGQGFGAMGPVPSVTLTQTRDSSGHVVDNPVAGSLVLNTSTNTITFLATNTTNEIKNGSPVLPDGTYTVEVSSSAATNGFQALNSGGGFLDGLGNGTPGSGDFVTGFRVDATNEDVVWVPATATGPGEPLEAPGRSLSGGGYPVYLTDNTGAVTNVSGTLTYNPNYLTVTSGIGGPGFTVNVNTPGTATFTYNGPPVQTGNTPLGYLNWAGALLPLDPSFSLASGGTLTAGATYYYKITSTNGSLESPGSVPFSIKIPAGTNQSVLLTWPQDPVATGYKLYRTTTTLGGSPDFGASSLLTTISGGATTTFTDTGSATTAGTPPLTTGFSTATVPNGTPTSPLTIYKAKDLLQVSATLNGGGVPSIGSSALHLVAFVGDADGNGVYTSGGDTVELTRVHLQTDSGFPAYPLIDPVILGDTDGDGIFDGDAAFQISELGVGAAAFSVAPVPNSVHVSPGDPSPSTVFPVGNGLDPTLTLPSTLQVGADGTVVVPINIDDPRPPGSTGLIEAELALTYNPRLFTVSPADVHAGSLLAGGHWSVVPTIDQATGQIGIALSSSTPISSATGGSLVTIDFHPTGAGSGQAQFALVASVMPNGQYVMTELEDTLGTFTLTPAPTNSFEPRIDGVVTLTPAAALVSPPVVLATETSSVVAPVEVQALASSTVATTVSATLATTSVVLPEESDESVNRLTADTVTQHLSAMHTAAAPAAPITGLVFQLANTSSANAQGSAGPHPADQFFQALVRGSANPYDPFLVGTVKDAVASVLAGQLLLAPSAADNLDSLSWDEVVNDQDWQGAGDSSALLGRHRRRDVMSNQTAPPAMVQRSFADRAILDRYFAQTSDDGDQATDDE